MPDRRRGPGSNQYQDKPPGPATSAQPAVAASLRQQAATEAGPASTPSLASNLSRDFDPDEAMWQHIAARRADPRMAAGLLPEGECADCDRLAANGGIVPRHNGRCRPHCTCDGCF